MNTKKIIVFWNHNTLGIELKSNVSFIVCISQSEFNELDKNTLKDAQGFLVLCELNWDDQQAEINNSLEFGGIRLVQRYLRKKMGLKAPVLFASGTPVEEICATNPENKIIKTPALKHFFVELPQSSEELKKAFDNIENMTNAEIAYTQLLYCDKRGLLVQINHVLKGRSEDEQNKYRKDIEYVLEEQFHNNPDLEEQYHNSKDLGDFCKYLLALLDSTDNDQTNDVLLNEINHKTIRILLLEDEPEKDENVKQFVNYIQEIERNAIKQKAIEMNEFEKDAEELKLKLLQQNCMILKAKDIALKSISHYAIGLSKREFEEKILQEKTTEINSRAKELEDAIKNIEEKESIVKVITYDEEARASDKKVIVLLEEAKALKKAARIIGKIAEVLIEVVKDLEIKDLERDAIAIKEIVIAIENKAKALEKKSFTKPLFTITVERNTDDIAYDPKHDPLASERKHSMIEFDVFISDIEIWDDKDELVTLGFNVVEAMAKESKRPLYYIVTNVSRSFYDEIKIPYVRRIRLKEEVFGTKEKIETFLYGIKEVFDNRETETEEKEFKCEKLFNLLFDFINKKDIYPKQFSVPFIDGSSQLMTIRSYDDIEDLIIKEKTQNLVDYFLSLFDENGFGDPKGNSQNFTVYDNNCTKMREYIKAFIGLGNGNLDKKVEEEIKNNQEPTDDDLYNFIVRLVLRRFFLYVKWFIDQKGLMQSFNVIKTKENNKKRKFTINDIACRAISEQYKTLSIQLKAGLLEGKPQSHCLDETLLFAKRDTLRLTDEEKNYVKVLSSTKILS